MTREQLAWHKILVEIKFDKDTADELMRQGIDSTEWAAKQDKLHHVLKGVSANKSPKCPDKSKIFMRADSQANLSTVCEWTKIRNLCSISSSATWWDKNSLKQTERRLAEITAFEKAAKKDTIKAPKTFKDMLMWEDFRDGLHSYASIVRGAAFIPLLYLLRKTSEVTMADYLADYDTEEERYIRCTAHFGFHYSADNETLWELLKQSVEKGSGWVYIKRFEAKKDGRRAYLALWEQAQTSSCSGLLKSQAHAELLTLKYDGPMKRHWTINKFCEQVMAKSAIIDRWNPPEAYIDHAKRVLRVLTLRDHESKAEKFIPFEMDGVISYLPTRKPSKNEIETCPSFWATSEAKWDSHHSKFEEDEKVMNGAFPRREINSVRIEVEAESKSDSADDTNSDHSSEMNVELHDASKQTFGEDLHLRWLQSMAQPQNLSALGIAEDGMLLDRMIRCRNLSDLSRRDRFTINPIFQREMDECCDTFQTKDSKTEQTIISTHLGETVR